MIQMMIHGCNGKMGRAIAALARESTVLTAVCGVDIAPDSCAQAFPVYADPQAVLENVDVVVDFSRPDGLAKLLPWCVSHHAALVLATTGLNEKELAMVDDAARYIPIFRASNMSLGVNVLRSLIASAAVTLGEGFDIEIIEKHHNQKVDAPSGTAITLAETITEALGGDHPLVNGRQGRTSKRTRPEIGMHAIRGGTVTGEHQVHFFGHDESISLTHIAQSREVFAAGALAAAAFLPGKAPGIYGMDEMLRERTGGISADVREGLAFLALGPVSPVDAAAFLAAVREQKIALYACEQDAYAGGVQLQILADSHDAETLAAMARSAAGSITLVEQAAEITAEDPAFGNLLQPADILTSLADRSICPYRLSVRSGRLSCLVSADAASSCMEAVAGLLR